MVNAMPLAIEDWEHIKTITEYLPERNVVLILLSSECSSMAVI